MVQIIPVILSGGQGTRLWPLSRQNMPKQFIPLIDGQSLFEHTIDRFSDTSLFESPLVICARDHRFLVKSLMGIHCRGIIVEPIGRNTAPALCAAAMFLQSCDNGNDPLLLLAPADHFIPDEEAFRADIRKAIPLASSGAIVTFGIQPSRPHTGFGYIERGEKTGVGFRVRKFHEKPCEADAKSYVANGRFLWNTGIFLMRSSVYLNELQKFEPDLTQEVAETLRYSETDQGDLILNEACFTNVHSKAIDIAVMERTHQACVIPVSFHWNDAGSWDALWGMATRDANENAMQGDVIAIDVHNSYLRSDGALLCAVGVENVIAVVEQGTVFIGTREKSEQIKNAIDAMKAASRQELTHGQRLFHPWGYYDVLADDQHFKVRRICVFPGQQMLLPQPYRSAHWTVIQGVAHVTKGHEYVIVQMHSTYAVNGGTLQLANRQDTMLEIIEVQSGDDLGVTDRTCQTA